jgi:GNAT superfamily N-acetyltransferase
MDAASLSPPDIRTLHPDAAAAACAVVRQSIAQCCAQDHHNDPHTTDAWLANKTPEQFARWMAAPGAMAWGAFRDGALVGVALLRQNQLALCYVLPSALHQGVGHALLMATEDAARQAGHTTMVLESTCTAHAFYARHGYAPAGDRVGWAGLWAQPMRKPL